ncbi:MAG TPA: hypothetical protein VKY74_22960 [Chloroflexia bacterium]|nr:hypothetical protein [Chloroflexia bacterium]
MVTLAELRAALRASLIDLESPPLWPDAVLDGCLDEAIAAHSYLFPWPTTVVFDVAPGAQLFVVYPLITAGPGPPGYGPAPLLPSAAADLISIQAVELPLGTPVPPDPWQSTDPANSGSGRYRQGYRWRANLLQLRNPASGPEVGPGRLRLAILQTYWRPAAPADVWNGPAGDQSLLILLAKRAAYQLLAEWQARTQGLTPATVPGPGLNLHLAIPPILAALEVQIARAITLRQQRNTRSRALDI